MALGCGRDKRTVTVIQRYPVALFDAVIFETPLNVSGACIPSYQLKIKQSPSPAHVVFVMGTKLLLGEGGACD
jgi:hypothetical protein